MVVVVVEEGGVEKHGDGAEARTGETWETETLLLWLCAVWKMAARSDAARQPACVYACALEKQKEGGERKEKREIVGCAR